MKEILFFCYGDSNKVSTWSNVPYLMAREFEKRGIKVNRVDLSCDSLFSRIMNHYYRLMKYGKNYSYIRTGKFKRLTEKKIEQAIKQYPDSECAVFLMFEFNTPKQSIPSLIFGDWTFRMLLEDRCHLVPTRHEIKFIERQRGVIENADIVLPLFSETYRSMLKDYPSANIKFIDNNVVNILYDGDIKQLETTIERKFKNKYVLFIGRPSYKAGLERLIKAVSSMKSIGIEVIGMTREDVPNAPSYCHFHGFLDKGDKTDNIKYYSLLKGARFICNPTPQWAGYSSIIEGMYFYTPVIISPFEQFKNEFGDPIPFGFYTNEDNLTGILQKAFTMPYNEYKQMASCAHNTVKDYTWSNYVDKMVEILNQAIDNYGTHKD